MLNRFSVNIHFGNLLGGRKQSISTKMTDAHIDPNNSKNIKPSVDQFSEEISSMLEERAKA